MSSSTAFLFSLVNKLGWGPVIFTPPGDRDSYQVAMYGCSDLNFSVLLLCSCDSPVIIVYPVEEVVNLLNVNNI